MADTKISSEETYQGIYPSVFKKIDNSDVTINPFQTYKSWTVLSGSATSSCLPLNAIYSDILPALETELTYNDAKNVDDSLQTVIYDSINHLFYKYRTQPYNTLGPTDLNRTKKYLYQSASVLSFPYKKIGEGIKPGSFTFTGSAFLDGFGLTKLRIHSDRYGNLYSSTFPTESIVTGVKFYEGFNECFDASRCNFDSRNVTFIPGIRVSYNTPSGNTFVPLGTAANFSNPGYIKTTIDGDYSRDSDYAISLFASSDTDLSIPFTGPNRLIIAKASGSNITQYPFKIEVNGNNDIICSIKGGTQTVQATTNLGIFVSIDSYQHILFQKTGSNVELYINSTFVTSASATWLTNTYNPLAVSARIDNDHPLMIGGTGISGETFSGSIDEIRIFNRALSTQEISNLYNPSEFGASGEYRLLQTNHVGNVFSKQGLVVVSTLDPRFHDILQQTYTASYKSTLTSYELGVVTKLDAGDFNLSLNPTLTKDNDVTYHSFVTGSSFAPYITTIGLYNDAGQLLAVGKLAQPIRKRNDVDTNFLIRIDLDKNITPATVLSTNINGSQT
jgi:hypothetical protein